MKTVILCRDLDSLASRIPPLPEHIRFLVLDESAESFSIRALFARRGQSEELPRAALFRERSDRFRSEYVNAIGKLNSEFGSREWWAMPFTTKNPISSDLCQDTFALSLIVDLIKKVNGCLVIVIDRAEVAKQAAIWGRAHGISIENAVKPSWSWKHLVPHFSLLPILFLAARSLWFMLRTDQRVSEAVPGTGPNIVMVTVVHPQSITADGRFRDTYFGELGEWLGRGKNRVSVAGLIQGQSLSLARAFQGPDESVVRFPIDARLDFRDIFLNTWECLRGLFDCQSRKIALEIGGVDIAGLVTVAVREAHASGEVFRSLYMYRCARRLASEFPIARCLYPYENRAWEKMLLLGMRSVSPQTRMIGYQHAAITASHTNFVFVDKEAKLTPLPDVVVTLGEVTRDQLIRDGYPPTLVRNGCALRQPRTRVMGSKRLQEKVSMRILVALGARMTEYLRVLSFLNETFQEEGSREIRLRPHPTLPLDGAILLLPGERTRFPHSISKAPVKDDLDWADVVLYASSTLGLEAVGAGIPAIYLDLGEMLDTDPMDGWTAFKWIARQPNELASILTEIKALSDAQYEARQLQGQSYVDAYLAPVNDESLRVFIEA